MKKKRSGTRLTLPEEVRLTVGQDFWTSRAMQGIPSIVFSDGPHGLRCQRGKKDDHLGIHGSLPATCFPAACLSACGWDENLLERMGEAIGEEAYQTGVNVVLGPGANIKRNPLCGRNFEYFSEDPYLSGRMAAAWIRGVQKKHRVAASLKHFCANNQEDMRMSSDSLVDARALHEVYLRPFEIAVKEGRPRTVMTAYNLLNGVYMSENKALLEGELRLKWGFDGLVLTDWGAMNDRVRAIEAGLDLQMPGVKNVTNLSVEQAVLSGRLNRKYLTRAAGRVEALARAVQPEAAPKESDSAAVWAQNDALAREIAENSAVLLKNDGAFWPLSSAEEICVLGQMADAPRYQGAGSSLIRATKVTSLLKALGEEKVSLRYAPAYRRDGSTDGKLVSDAVALARQGGKVIFVLGLPDAYESEGFDRRDMRLPEGMLQALDAVLAVNPETGIVLLAGAPTEMPYADRVRAILYMGLAGQNMGGACADILLGKYNPSGKLAETYPIRYEDCASSEYYGVHPRQAQYREGLYVGYRYYQSAKVPVRYPFGFGLSYTSFSYSSPEFDGRRVLVSIQNTGNRAGSEVIQVYATRLTQGAYRPVRVLAGFQKVHLLPGEEKRVSIEIDVRAFCVYDESVHDFVREGGQYLLSAGGSSDALPVSVSADVPGQRYDASCESDFYRNPGLSKPTESDFRSIYGEFTPFEPETRGSYTLKNTLLEMSETCLLYRLVIRLIRFGLRFTFDRSADDWDAQYRMMLMTAISLPMHNLLMLSRGHIKLWQVKSAVSLANLRGRRPLKNPPLKGRMSL